jgi:hypothetical protein
MPWILSAAFLVVEILAVASAVQDGPGHHRLGNRIDHFSMAGTAALLVLWELQIRFTLKGDEAGPDYPPGEDPRSARRNAAVSGGPPGDPADPGR